MWGYVKDNKVEEIIRFPRTFIDTDNIKHPRAILNMCPNVNNKTPAIIPKGPALKNVIEKSLINIAIATEDNPTAIKRAYDNILVKNEGTSIIPIKPCPR